ncbi:hypothetical protein BLS_003347 [Venturia inaequalis]|uniref:Uncharacterized protein n=1 Tax=Venturia inaequalis TaxID=5025 RepID=A0A8H3V691_VENIN|nr:hypothetical protein BLS_003347 [Venturia inaequalis]KAE9984728.1 hypothetical protein EG328_008345 [Venturia inaequalis]KAE9992906.1 hypothetical protein EG327_007383 [Venturia inaequalis]RDI85051.1 hypothetical protein Vi05172_g4983 [Venturia inaequalis]
MRYYLTALSFVGLCTISALAAKSSKTKTQSYSYAAPDPESTQFIGLLSPTAPSVNTYLPYTCSDSEYTTSGKFFTCYNETTVSFFPTSCGGDKTKALYFKSGVSSKCPAKATCVTDLVYDDKNDKNPVTGIDCMAESRAPTFTLYRSNPPEIRSGKHSGASGFGGQYITLGALFAGFFTLGMAIML